MLMSTLSDFGYVIYQKLSSPSTVAQYQFISPIVLAVSMVRGITVL